MIVLGNYLKCGKCRQLLSRIGFLCLFAHILWISDQCLRYILASRFAYLRQKLLKISEAQEKEEILTGSQITQLFEDQDFSKN